MILKTAQDAAHKAGRILLENFGKISGAQIREKQKNDFLTYVDELSEQRIIETIRTAFPDHGILAEESGIAERESAYRWIIDPLDGTKNYICGISIYGISIALEYNKNLIVGVVYDPVRDDMFYAETGKGAFLNGNKIGVSREKDLSKCLIATGFPFKYKQYLHKYMVCFEEVFVHCSGIRRMGAASIDLAYTAAGKFDGFWELGLNPWDVAAGALIIREAGGTITDFWGGDDFLSRAYIIATNGHIHSKLVKIMENHFPNYQPIKQQG